VGFWDLTAEDVANPVGLLAAVVINFAILWDAEFAIELLFRFADIFFCEAVVNEPHQFVAEEFVELGRYF